MLAAPTLVLLAEGAEKDIDELMAGIARSWSSTWCSGDHFTMLAQLVRGHEKWMTEAREVRAAGGCLAPLLGASKRSELFGLILALQSGFVAIWGSERHHPAMSEGLGSSLGLASTGLPVVAVVESGEHQAFAASEASEFGLKRRRRAASPLCGRPCESLRNGLRIGRERHEITAIQSCQRLRVRCAQHHSPQVSRASRRT